MGSTPRPDGWRKPPITFGQAGSYANRVVRARPQIDADALTAHQRSLKAEAAARRAASTTPGGTR